MSADPAASTVLLNGNNFDLNGANLELDDDELEGDDKSISGLFNRALAGRTSATVEYRWDNPEIDTDDVEGFFMNRKVPGTSLKRSYIEVADINDVLPTADLYWAVPFLKFSTSSVPELILGDDAGRDDAGRRDDAGEDARDDNRKTMTMDAPSQGRDIRLRAPCLTCF